MAFAVRATLRAIESYIKASGYFQLAQVGEYKMPPSIGTKLAAAAWMARAGVVGTTLTTTIELHTVNLRIYRDALAEPSENGEFQVSEAVSEVLSDLLGEYDLGATIRNIDAAGQYGQSVGVEWGYADISGHLYRIADITLPLIVDDSATFAA